MNDRRKILLWSVSTLAVIASAVISIATFAYYLEAVEQRKLQLEETVTTHAHFIASVARFDAFHSKDVMPGGAREATLSQIKDAHENYRGFGRSGEFVLAERRGDYIEYLAARPLNQGAESLRIPWDSELAQPTRLALSKENGVAIGFDYQNQRVLAAYRYIEELDIGIVAKIDMAELNRPFILTAAVCALASLVLITLGGFFSIRLINPLIRKLEKAMHDAKAADRTKTEFLANISHEIRTPMTAILGFADLLMTGPGTEEQRRAAGIIKRNGDYLLQIINDILDLSGLEAGKAVIARQECSPRSIAEEVVALMRIRAEAKNLLLTFRCSEAVPDKIFSDHIRIRQVLINLISNAIKFTGQGAVHVSLTPDIRDGDNPFVVFDVSDTGIGIEADKLERIFEPFERCADTSSRLYEGTGLGLMISKRFATMMGGGLSVESEPGKGSRFSFSVPVGAGEDANKKKRPEGRLSEST